MRTTFTTALACVLALLAACQTTSGPSGSPEEVAARIVTAVDEGRVADAAALFEDAAANEDLRQKLYPRLYEEAEDRFASGDAAGATALLRLMAAVYPDADAVQRALLYSLFQLRGQSDATPELLAETDAALETVRSQPNPPVWVDLVTAQLRIDQGRLAEAQTAYARFAGAWDGEPEAIAIYVEDVERYLASH